MAANKAAAAVVSIGYLMLIDPGSARSLGIGLYETEETFRLIWRMRRLPPEPDELRDLPSDARAHTIGRVTRPLGTTCDRAATREVRRTASAVQWQFVTLGGTDGSY